MRLINLTPHPITIVNDNCEQIALYPPSGTVVRAGSTQSECGMVDGIPLVETVFDLIDELPEPQEGTAYIVSWLVITNLPYPRYDFVAPDTGPDSAVRDEDGRIIAVRRLQRPEW